jgi:hypothetical protein
MKLLAATLLLIIGTAAASADPSTQPARDFVVFGRVVDASGKPVEGANIRANCGVGTLLPTGEATTDADGKYRLEFGPGLHERVGDQWRVGMQAATIFCGKDGCFEKNLCRQGDLAMSDLTPDDEREKTWKCAGIVRPHQPLELNFQLLPAASLAVQLTDDHGQPLKGIMLSLSGNKLPPSCSVLANEHTDDQGRVIFKGIPTGDWWFECRPKTGGRDLRSDPLHVTEAADYRATLTLTDRSLQGQLLPPVP